MRASVLAIFCLFCLYSLSEAKPYPDNAASSTGGHGHGHGRVQIKVYRGQSKPHGHGHYGHEYFAPYGYWVRQPPDHGGHHGGY